MERKVWYAEDPESAFDTDTAVVKRRRTHKRFVVKVVLQTIAIVLRARGKIFNFRVDHLYI